VGAADAEELVKEFTPTFTEEDIVNLPKYEMYLKLMIDGIASDPFSARGLPPLPEEEKTNNVEKVINITRERYAKPKTVVEEKIMRWHEPEVSSVAKKPIVIKQDYKKSISNRSSSIQTREGNNNRRIESSVKNNNSNATFRKVEPEIEGENLKESDRKENNSGVYQYKAICSRCGKETILSFKPDLARPIFCRDCLSLLRKEKRDEAEKRKIQKKEELKNIAQIEDQSNKNDGITLSQAKQMKPVEFKKNSFKNSESLNKKEAPKQSNFDSGGRDIKEGEEVNL